MNVPVPANAMARLFAPSAPGVMDCWTLTFRPACEPGEVVRFRFGGRDVARAVIVRAEQRTRRDGSLRELWAIVWDPATFEDLRFGEFGASRSAEVSCA